MDDPTHPTLKIRKQRPGGTYGPGGTDGKQLAVDVYVEGTSGQRAVIHISGSADIMSVTVVHDDLTEAEVKAVDSVPWLA